MKKGDIKTITLYNDRDESYKVQARFLGAGAFSKVYEYNGRVLAFVDISKGFNESDYSKESISVLASGVNVPEITKFYHGENLIIFEMPLYTPLDASHVQAWADFKKILKIWESTPREYKEKALFFSRRFESRIIESDLSDDIKESISAIIDAGANYGDDYAIEICKRNLAVDSKGRLILLDILFNSAALKWNRK